MISDRDWPSDATCSSSAANSSSVNWTITWVRAMTIWYPMGWSAEAFDESDELERFTPHREAPGDELSPPPPHLGALLRRQCEHLGDRSRERLGVVWRHQAAPAVMDHLRHPDLV